MRKAKKQVVYKDTNEAAQLLAARQELDAKIALLEREAQREFKSSTCSTANNFHTAFNKLISAEHAKHILASRFELKQERNADNTLCDVYIEPNKSDVKNALTEYIASILANEYAKEQRKK